MLDWSYLILFDDASSGGYLHRRTDPRPAMAVRHTSSGSAVPACADFGLYFLALGLAFLFIEIAFIQRFALFLGHPFYAVAVVLAGFLVFAGVGSAFAAAPRRAPGGGRQARLAFAVGGYRPDLAAATSRAAPAIPMAVAALGPAKIAVALFLIAPLGAFHGDAVPARNCQDIAGARPRTSFPGPGASTAAPPSSRDPRHLACHASGTVWRRDDRRRSLSRGPGLARSSAPHPSRDAIQVVKPFRANRSAMLLSSSLRNRF